MIAAGQLRQRVSIQTRTETSDSHRGYTESWSTVRRRVSASVLPLAGRDLERARQIDPRASHEITLRFWDAYPTDLDGGRARLVWHDGTVGDRTLELVEPPREIECRVALAVTAKESA